MASVVAWADGAGSAKKPVGADAEPAGAGDEWPGDEPGTQAPQPIILCQTCGDGVCQAVAGLASGFLKTLANADKATATVYRPDRHGVTLTLSRGWRGAWRNRRNRRASPGRMVSR